MRISLWENKRKILQTNHPHLFSDKPESYSQF